MHYDKTTQTNESTHSEMGPVWQNPIQKTIRTAHLSALMTVHNFRTQYNTEQFWLVIWRSWSKFWLSKFIECECEWRNLFCQLERNAVV